MQDIPVFIGGFRSGTTLLINLLGLHPQITPWFETKELCEALRWQRVLQQAEQAVFEAAYCASEPPGFTLRAVHERMLFQIRATHARLAGARTSGKAAHERYPLGNDYVGYSLQEAEAALTLWHDAIAKAGTLNTILGTTTATGNLIRTLGARQQALHGAGVSTTAAWINKTPEISRFAPELRAALGRCKIIYVVRDGIEVVASGLRLGWGNVEELAFNWKGLLERSRAAMQGHEADYLELRYEQLVLEPEATLNRVLRFCGREEQGAEVVRLFSTQWSASGSPFDTSRMQGSNSLNAAQLRVFTAVAGDMQAALGYPAPACI